MSSKNFILLPTASTIKWGLGREQDMFNVKCGFVVVLDTGQNWCDNKNNMPNVERLQGDIGDGSGGMPSPAATNCIHGAVALN